MARELDRANEFGGAYGGSMYIPLTEIEQEVISRLAEAGEFIVVFHGFGSVPKLDIRFGDKNLHIGMKVGFPMLSTPQSVYFFDMELKTHSGISLFRQTMPCTYDDKPLLIGPEVEFEMIWDISINTISPALVKQIKPGAIGLTSRRQDRDTGDMTLIGNMKLTEAQKQMAYKISQGEQKVKKMDLDRILKHKDKHSI